MAWWRSGPPGGDRDMSSAELARYRYLLRTASPGVLLRAHTEALSLLPDRERRAVQDVLATLADRPEALRERLGRSATPDVALAVVRCVSAAPGLSGFLDSPEAQAVGLSRKVRRFRRVRGGGLARPEVPGSGAPDQAGIAGGW